jgi:hypothetical protein
LDIILTIFVVANIAPVFATNKVSDVFGWAITGGTYIAPFIFIIIGLVAEVYGSKIAQRFTYLGLASAWLTTLTLQLIGWLPASPESIHEGAYQTITSSSLRITFAGLVAFLATSYSRIFLLKFFEKILNIESFGVRNYLALFINQAINQSLFISISFYGEVSNSFLWQIMWQGYIVLIGVEILVGIFLPNLATWLKKHKSPT